MSCTPFVFLSRKDDEESVLKGYELGAEDYITKPFFRKGSISAYKGHPSPQSRQKRHTGTSGFTGSYQHDSQMVYRIKMLIQNGNFTQAQQLLDSMQVRDSSWHYLQGLLFLRRGWYDRANVLLRRAVDMEPNNMEYREALNRVSNQYYGYRHNPYYHGSGYRQSPDMCSICTTLWCADSLCECCGGDLIGCC
jgi:molecular chaperone DnaJ